MCEELYTINSLREIGPSIRHVLTTRTSGELLHEIRDTVRGTGTGAQDLTNSVGEGIRKVISLFERGRVR